MALGSFSIFFTFISPGEDTGKFGGKNENQKRNWKGNVIIFLRNDTIGDEAVLYYLLGAVSDATKRPPFVCKGLHRVLRM